MVNIDKLRGAMRERRISVEELAAAIGIDDSTLYRRLSDNGETFTIKEVDKIVKSLDLPVDVATAIFFSSVVA